MRLSYSKLTLSELSPSVALAAVPQADASQLKDASSPTM